MIFILILKEMKQNSGFYKYKKNISILIFNKQSYNFIQFFLTKKIEIILINWRLK